MFGQSVIVFPRTHLELVANLELSESVQGATVQLGS